MFSLNISTDNAAFNEWTPSLEIARILREVARRVENDEQDGWCIDVNGNTVGDWSLGR